MAFASWVKIIEHKRGIAQFHMECARRILNNFRNKLLLGAFDSWMNLVLSEKERRGRVGSHASAKELAQVWPIATHCAALHCTALHEAPSR